MHSHTYHYFHLPGSYLRAQWFPVRPEAVQLEVISVSLEEREARYLTELTNWLLAVGYTHAQWLHKFSWYNNRHKWNTWVWL